MEKFQVLTIDQVFESPLNPRRTYNEKKMEELIESVRAKGILMPLLVRPANTEATAGKPNNNCYEIAAGHRRYRAAVKLQLPDIPVIIREMSDTDFLEILTIENLQREDLQPLEEAQGYRTLMERVGHDVASIAARIGKSESYIYQRLKLLDLIPEAQDQLAKDKITAGHAVLIARLQPNEQKECLKEIGEEAIFGPGLSVRNLANFIEREIHLDLNSASFSKKDPDLVPEAGPCTTCPKRTGFTPALFPDIKKKDTCTDPACFQQKIEAYTAHWLEKKSQDSDVAPLKLSGDSNYQKKKIPNNPEEPIPVNLYTEIPDKKKWACEHIREGIITQGRNKGKVLTVCTDPKCEVHHTRGGYTPGPKELARRKTEAEKNKIEEIISTRILDDILKGAYLLSQEDKLFIIAGQFNALWDEYKKRILKRHGWEAQKGQYGGRDYRIEKILAPMKDADLNRLSLEMALISCVRFNKFQGGSEKPLIEVANRHNIDVKAIENQVKAEVSKKTKGPKKIKTHKKAVIRKK